MVRKPTLFILFIFLPFCLYGGPNNYRVGARFAGMGNATVMIPDLWSVSHNQAGLGWVRSVTTGFHFENKFVVPQYSLSAAGLAIPVKPGTLGMMLQYFGYSQYHESRFSLAFGRAFTEQFAVGIQLNYMSRYIADGYGSFGVVIPEGGMIISPFKNVFVGAHIFNPFQTHLNNPEQDMIPTIFRVGFGLQLLDQIFISAESETSNTEKPVFKTGIEINAVNNLFFRAGYSTQPNKPSFGLGYLFMGFRGDIAFTLHPQLGFTPFFSLMYSF